MGGTDSVENPGGAYRRARFYPKKVYENQVTDEGEKSTYAEPWTDESWPSLRICGISDAPLPEEIRLADLLRSE